MIGVRLQCLTLIITVGEYITNTGSMGKGDVFVGEAAQARPRSDGSGAGSRSVVVDRHTTDALGGELSDVAKCHHSTACER